MATKSGTPVRPGSTVGKIAYQHEAKHHVLVNVGTVEWARYPSVLNNVYVQINDLREVYEFKPSLDKNGFAKVERLEPLPAGLKEGDARILEEAYASITETLKRETGCSDVHIFSHVVRDAAFQRIPDVPADADPMAKWPHKTPQFARVDQSYAGAGSTLENTLGQLPEERAEVLRSLGRTRRWAIINTWRPLSTVYREPLAIADGRTVSEADLRVMEVDPSVLFKRPSPTTELWQAVYRPEHEWWYVSNMTNTEALMFKCFDTRMETGSNVTCRRTIHSTFQHPEDNGPPCQSCEFRALCFWEDEKRTGDSVEHAYQNFFSASAAAASNIWNDRWDSLSPHAL